MKKYNYVINGVSYEVSISEESDLSAKVEVNGELYLVEKHGGQKSADQPVAKPRPKPVETVTPVAKPAAPTAQPKASAVPAGGAAITSPLPGVVMKVLVKAGDAVTEGQTVLVLESMKMENEIGASRSGHILSVNCDQGQQVTEGDVLVVIGD